MTTQSTSSAASPLRERFLEAGMTILAREGYADFKQATVCAETGLTTGAFYHSFRNWREFGTALIEYWRSESTDRLVAWLDTDVDPLVRSDALVDVALDLPHAAEAAIRTWAAGDPAVRQAVDDVDAVRTQAIVRYTLDLGVEREHARHLARTAMLLLIGHQTAGSAVADLEWSMRHLLATDPHVQAGLTRLREPDRSDR
ncbi:TetR/AcrR family transcriptional regulator [Gordonia sp. PP30]|uniref:TetR/AcrR family transcriptional regulator n=1 Tax=Gordonia sp. PP30 TaxID=2935861 RepID=UPI001FFF868C|nr:TetR/AcrR family transcriptional regulator [Gordonia sp. PP30]UQE75453.1 TetR/AcrR family transcriptional regulator [Gordonia sp. PP30]